MSTYEWIWQHIKADIYIYTWQHVYANIWIYIATCEYIRQHLNTYGNIWRWVAAYECIRQHMNICNIYRMICIYGNVYMDGWIYVATWTWPDQNVWQQMACLLHIYSSINVYFATSNRHYNRHCNTHCNTLQHTATHCNTLRHTVTVAAVAGQLWQLRTLRIEPFRLEEKTFSSGRINRTSVFHCVLQCLL